ncbi:MAG TPA: cytochrome c oxidase assembly protein [Burkholderiales bacterium]|nr:cytochrome c oxidase assembly protein [Burkholderiales bacterium]
MKRIACAVALALTAQGAKAHAVAAGDAEAGLRMVVGALLVLSALLYAAGYYRVSQSSARLVAVRRSAALFGAGWLTVAIALVSPLAAMTAGLFGAHMMQHELLMVVAAPLLVLGRPLAMWMWALPRAWRAAPARVVHAGAFARVWDRLASPIGASVVHGAAIWLWHIPRVFELSEVSVGAHALQHAAFLFSALLFWWALLKPVRGGRVGTSVMCLFVTMLHTGALGVLLTFSGQVWYPAATAHAAHWSLTALEDQQLGGLVMWIVGGLPYVAAALALAARWFLTRESAEVPAPSMKDGAPGSSYRRSAA